MFRFQMSCGKSWQRCAGRLFVLVLASLFASCAGKRMAAENSFAVVTAPANLYENGPAQASGRDLELTRGQTVAVLEHSLGYSQVRTTEGVIGYVPSRFLKPSPAPQLASHFSNAMLLNNSELPGLNRPGAPASSLFNANDFGDVFPKASSEDGALLPH